MLSWASRLVLCAVAALALSACGPSEGDHRQAFKTFLETEVLARKGTSAPQPNDEKLKTFGDYAAGYAVITRFHQSMNASVAKPMAQVVDGASPRTIEEAVNRKTEIEAVRSGLAAMRKALDEAVAAADRDKAALKQPDDLASLYGKAYDKLVTRPAAAFREVFPAMDGAMASILSLADLIAQNRAKVKLQGSLVEVEDPALRSRIEAAMQAANDKREAVVEAQQKLQKVFYGG